VAVGAPLGQQVHLALVNEGPEAAITLARQAGQHDLFERVAAVAAEPPSLSFLHSALCAMSLPVRRPLDEHAPIIRQDGQYTLVINPKPIVEVVDGLQRVHSLGVPYGSLPRLVLIHVMTEAVRTKSRHIVLGATFADWMRRMGFRTVSYGPRGSATLVKEQLDRLLACEWMIRWETAAGQGEREFAIKEIKLTNEYAGVDRKSGGFVREILMTEGFFEHLRHHAVPLNENAIRQLRDSATALDLYTWLAYRLPRIVAARPATISWQQLAVHFGNSGANMRKFRQTIRDAWERQVSAVYPEAKAEFGTGIIKLYASPAPLQQKFVPGMHLKLVSDDGGAVSPPDKSPEHGNGEPRAKMFIKALVGAVGLAEARAWFQHATLEECEGEWVLLVPSAFFADWIRSHYGEALRSAGTAAGLADPPMVRAREIPAAGRT
jgi:hypothetical protein